MTISSLLTIKKKEKCDVVKLIVLTIIRGYVPNLKSNIKYIQTYRHKSLISSEDDYFLSLVDQGIKYIENLNLTTLKLNNDQITTINNATNSNINNTSINININEDDKKPNLSK